MKLLLGLLLALSVSALAQTSPAPKLELKAELLHPLLLKTAARIEERFQRIHPEADGLAKIVESILAMPVPEKKDTEGDPAARIAARMQLMSATVGFGVDLAGGYGYIFDNSDIGHQQTYHDLELETATDAAEVRRWLEMKLRAEKLEWKDKVEMCSQRAIAAARALVSREPKNADAHAFLAFALDWEGESASETLSSLETALKLNPKHALAQQFMLFRRVQKAAEAAAHRREFHLDEKAPQDATRAFYDHPLDETELNAFTRAIEGLRTEADKTLANAYEQRDLPAYLLTLSTGMSIENELATATLARKRDPNQSYEAFAKQSLSQKLLRLFSLFDNQNRARDAIELASDNGEALGTLVVLGAVGRMNHLMSSISDPSKVTDEMLFIPGLQERVLKIAREKDGPNAARACEAVCLVEMMRSMVGMQPRHQDLILRMIERDPFRHSTFQYLLVACLSSPETKAAACAITRMQLAVLPCMLTRRQSAASAASMHDWDTAQRILDTAEREKPGDLMVLSQRVATTLRQSQSKAAIKKATLLYGPITPDTVLEKTAALPKDDRSQFLENFLLHLALKRDPETATQLLNQAVEAQILDEKAAKELRSFFDK